eukprot:PhF_6_TR32973/c0_g1_i1/m.48543
MSEQASKLVSLFQADQTKLAELSAQLNETSTFAQHQDYNTAFDKSRKEFDAEAQKIQAFVEESLKKLEADKDAALAAAQADSSAATKLKTEASTLNEASFNAEDSIKQLNAQVGAAQTAKISSNELSSFGEAEISFFADVNEATIKVRSASYNLVNKVKNVTKEDLEAIGALVTKVEKAAPSSCEDTVKAVKAEYTNLVTLATRQSEDGSSTEQRLKVDTAKREFLDESAKLLQWCRQMKTDLEALIEPDHIQKFCALLENNYSTMEENFDTLCEMGRVILPDSQVEKALIECNEVWLNLQIFAHEVLQHTLLEIHARSKLEDEVRAFAGYSTRFNQLLKEVKDMLSLPQDEESKEVVKAILSQTENLQRDFTPHLLLADHLRDFSLRMECIRDNYSNLRRTVFGRLTFLSQQHLPLLNTSHRRRDEYVARMKDLKTWVEKKDLGESATDIYSRVLKIKALIDEEYEHVRRLPEETTTAAAPSA